MKRVTFYIILLFLVLQSTMTVAQKKLKFKKSEKAEKVQLAEYEFAEGMKYYILGNFQEALSHFETTQKLNGENAALDYLLATIYYRGNRTDLALKYANKAVDLDKKNKYYYLLAANIYQKQQNNTEAIKLYKKLIAEIPQSEEFYYNLSDLYYDQKNYDESLKSLEKIEAIYGKSLPVTQRKQDIYVKKGNLEKAIEEGNSLIKAFPDDSEFKAAQAEFLFTHKMTDQAIQILENIIKTEPDNSYARLLLSDIYQASGNTEKSDKELESVFNDPQTDLETKLNIISGFLKAQDSEYNRKKALSLSETTVKIHNSDARAYAVYGESLRRSGKKEEAWKNFIKAKNLDNSNFPVWLEILAIDADMSAGDSLVKHSEEALESFPNQAMVWMYNGLGHSLKKNYTQAIEALNEGKKLSGNNLELLNQFNLQLGDAYYYSKNYPKSDAAFEEVLKADGNNPHALNNYSYFLSLRKEKLELAKNMSTKLVTKYPKAAGYLDTHAWVLYQMKNYQEAKNYLEKAIEGSKNGTIIEHYGDVLYQLGQKEQAVEQWKKAKSLGDTSETIDKKIADKKLYE